MKIEAGGVGSSEMQTDWSARQASSNMASAPISVQNGDRTTLSRDTATMKSLVSQAMATPEVRQDKVSELRQAVSSGNYKVDTQQLAAAMINGGID
jgi:negative regulator of flagellin synthesis FlgM